MSHLLHFLASIAISPNSRYINTTSIRYLIQKWRKEKGLPMNPNAYGVLTDTPDYTFLDGRPTPIGVNQKQRMIKQKEILDKIIQLNSEIDFAIERHAKLKEVETERRKKIIEGKLKPKGSLLLKNK